jgi:hypothetical protein
MSDCQRVNSRVFFPIEIGEREPPKDEFPAAMLAIGQHSGASIGNSWRDPTARQI